MGKGSIISAITILLSALIIGVFIWTWRFVSEKMGDDLQSDRNWLEQITAVLSALGVIGRTLIARWNRQVIF